MSETDRHPDRRAGGIALVAGGGLLAAFVASHLLATGVGPVANLLLGVFPGLLLAGLLAVVGVWLFRHGPTGRQARRLLGWAVVSGLVGVASTGLFVFYEGSRGATLVDVRLAIANTAAGFAILGILVGRYDLQARQYATRLTRYRNLFENVPVGIFRTAPGPEGQFVEVNPAMVEMVGADSEDDLLGTDAAEIYVDPEERAAFSERLLEEEVVVERESRFRRANGDVFFGSVTAIKHEWDGQTYFDGILEDVTERRQYQGALERHNDRLGVLNDVLRHDVRNDMAVVRARGELLREHLDSTDRQEDLRAVLDRVDHVVSLTETARDFAEVVSADRSGKTERIDLAPLLEEEVQTANRSHDDAIITTDGDLPDVAVRADDMLSSVVNNLLDNAVGHNDKETPEVTVSVEARQEEVAIRVADNGPGIPDPQKDAIFHQGEKGEETGGTGLGLYLVETLVEQYGGRVSVADNEPRGAVFTVILSRLDTREDPALFD